MSLTTNHSTSVLIWISIQDFLNGIFTTLLRGNIVKKKTFAEVYGLRVLQVLYLLIYSFIHWQNLILSIEISKLCDCAHSAPMICA